MSKRINSSKLRTLNDVHKAQKYVCRKISNVEEQLLDDYDDFSEMLSVNYWLEELLGRVPKLIPVVQSAAAAYTFVSSLFDKSCRR